MQFSHPSASHFIRSRARTCKHADPALRPASNSGLLSPQADGPTHQGFPRGPSPPGPSIPLVNPKPLPLPPSSAEDFDARLQPRGLHSLDRGKHFLQTNPWPVSFPRGHQRPSVWEGSVSHDVCATGRIQFQIPNRFHQHRVYKSPWQLFTPQPSATLGTFESSPASHKTLISGLLNEWQTLKPHLSQAVLSLLARRQKQMGFHFCSTLDSKKRDGAWGGTFHCL